MEYKKENLEFVKNLNDDKKVVDMLLFGEIGSERKEGMFNGDDFGREMVFLSNVGFKLIRLNINSIGGGILKGMSIINAMNTVRMNNTSIETHVVGVADSMAGIISSFGDRGSRTVANFGSGLVHGPMAQTKEGKLIPIEEMPEGEVKTEALHAKESLITLMVSSTGKTRTEIKKAMKAAKRLNANEMKSFGMVDKVVKLSNEKVDIENKSAIELMAACSKIDVEPKSKTMKLVNKVLNLNEDAAESSAVEKITNLKNEVSTHKTSIEEKDKEILKLKGEKDTLVNAAQEAADTAAEAYVDALIEGGKLKKESREALVDQAKKDLPGFKAITESLEVTFVDVTKDLKGADDDDGTGDEKLAKEYHKHDVAGTLKNVETKSPAKFAKMEKAYLASDVNFDEQ